jgi:protocatechuate 4,5-dioxygenase, beta chain
MARSSAASPPRTCPPSAAPSPARGLQQEPYWKPFFDAFVPVHAGWPSAPDVAVVVYNDHGLNFFLDKMPTFAVGAAPNTATPTRAGASRRVPPFPGDAALSWHLIESLVGEDFDLTTCQEMLVDHAFTLPMALLWPDQRWPVPRCRCASTPCSTRCPAPRAATSWAGDRPRGRRWPGDASVRRDGHRRPERTSSTASAPASSTRTSTCAFMDSLSTDPRWATQYSTHELVEQAGTQGVELLMWLTARAALGPRAKQVHANYHIPISNTAAGLMLGRSTGTTARRCEGWASWGLWPLHHDGASRHVPRRRLPARASGNRRADGRQCTPNRWHGGRRPEAG